MGIRCTQVMSLSSEACDFLQKNCKKVPMHQCPSCGHEYGEMRLLQKVYDDVTGREAGMHDDGPPLFEYELKDGSIVREIVQDVPWSSGPCIFLCLEDESGNRMFKWPEEKLNNC